MPLCDGIHREKRPRGTLPPQPSDPLPEIRGRRQFEQGATIGEDGEANPGVGQGQASHDLVHRPRFRADRPQEARARGSVEEERAHLHGGATAAGVVFHRYHPAALDADPGADLLAFSSFQRHPGHCRDRGQGFTPEPEAVDAT